MRARTCRLTSPAPADARMTDSSRLARRLGTTDAVVVGLGAMIGAGIFGAVAPAAAVSGRGILLALAVAALVAWLNATAVARLARLLPTSGGAYAYGRERLGPVWGFIGGWAFVSGKVASCAAMALTVGSYAVPDLPILGRGIAILTIGVLSSVNLAGVQKTAAATRAIVIVVVATLLAAVAATLSHPGLDTRRLVPSREATSFAGVLQGAGLLFFAFAGYARIATLGEEVREPARAIPRAISIALGVTVLLYGMVIAATVAALDPTALAATPAPLARAVESSRVPQLAPAVRVGAVVASVGVLLSLLAGVSRTVFAMAANRDLPLWLSAVHPVRRIPYRAEIGVALVVAALVVLVDLRSAIGFSAFNVLCYYAVANASAWTIPPGGRGAGRGTAALGLGGCMLVAVMLPPASVLGGIAVLTAGVLVWALSGRRGPQVS